jgi:hypothetical protein
MAFVQAFKAGSASVDPLQVAGNTTTGNCLVAIVSVGSGPRTVSSFTDSAGNTWTALTGNPQAPQGQFNVYGYVAQNITGATPDTLTADFNAAGVSAIAFAEFSGRATTSVIAFQGANLEVSGSTSHSSASTGTLPSTGCDMVCIFADNVFEISTANQTYTATSGGWTMSADGTVSTGATTATCGIMHRANVDTSSQQATWTNSNGNVRAASWIIALAAAAAAGSANLLVGKLGQPFVGKL